MCFAARVQAILLLLMLVSNSAAQTIVDDKQAVLAAIEQLRQRPAWQHLKAADANLDQSLIRNGPELNASLFVKSPSGKPVEGALVVVLESSRDLFNGVLRSGGYLHKAELITGPLAIRASDHAGRVILSGVRRSASTMRSPSEKPTVARAFAIALHPSFGLTVGYLKETDESQELTISMSEDHTYRGQLITKGTNLSLSNTWLRLNGWSSQNLDLRETQAAFLPNTPFAPQVNVGEDGHFEFSGLPGSGWISIHVVDATTNQSIAFSRSELTQLTLDLTVEALRAGQPKILVRCVDEVNDQPIPGCKIGETILWQATDQQGCLTTTYYSKTIFSNPEDPADKREGVVIQVRPPTGFVTTVFKAPLPKDGEALELKIPRGVRLAGRVVDDRTSKGIGGVDLQFTDFQGSQAIGFQTTYRISATTDSDGKFEVYAPKTKLAAGISSLVRGYEVPTTALDTEIRDLAKLHEPFQQIVDLEQQPEATELEFRLKRAKPLQGIVLDTNGKPASNCRVALQQTLVQASFSSIAKTDSKGVFQIPFIPGGVRKSTVVAFMEGSHATVSVSVDFSRLGSYEGGPVILDLRQAREARSIVGRVLVDGKGEPNVLLMAYRDDPEEKVSGGAITSTSKALAQGTTNERGEFTIPIDDPEAEYCHVSVVQPEHLMSWSHSTVRIDGKTSYPIFDFKTRYGDLAISGQVVTPDGDSVVGASISAHPEGRVQLTRIYRDRENPNSSTSSVSDAEGKFECKNLGEGRVQLQIRPVAEYNTWSRSAFQSVVTNAGKSNFMLTIDPRLSVPPPEIQPISITKLDSVIPFDRFKSNGREFKLQGKVVDSIGAPIKGATAFVIAVRHVDAPNGPSPINPLMHPVCGLEAKSDADGDYSLTIPDDELIVCVGIAKVGYLPTLTKYLTEGAGRQIHRLKSPEPSQAPARPDWTWNLGAASAVLVSARTSRNNYIDSFAFEGSDWTDLSDQKGIVKPPRTYSSDNNYLIFDPGQPARLLNHFSLPGNNAANRSFSVKGRIVDQRGPVADYRVCCSSGFRELVYETHTDQDGRFQFDGLLFQNYQPKSELYLYGNIAAQDARGWLKTRIVQQPEQNTMSELGDLKLDSARRLTIQTVDSNGTAFDGKGRVIIAMRQQGPKPLTIPLNGQKVMEIQSLPSEPVTIRFEAGRTKFFAVEPEFQRLGFLENGNKEIGLPMNADTSIVVSLH